MRESMPIFLLYKRLFLLKNKYWPLHEPETKAFVKTIKDEASICFFFFSSRRWAFRNDSFVLSQKLPTFVKQVPSSNPSYGDEWRSLLRHCFDALNKVMVVVVVGGFLYLFFSPSI